MKNLVVILLSFAAGAVMALCVSSFISSDNANAQIPKAPSGVSKRQASEDARALAALQERLSNLERQLADAGAVAPRDAHEPVQIQEDLEKPEFGETDEARRQRLEAAFEKIDFLSPIEVDGMGRQERRSHERLLKQLARREELTDMIESDIPQEERDALIAERKEVEAAISDLNQKVRKNLLSIVARNLGVEKEDAKDVVKVIVEIIKMTE